ncbi:MAG TPA: hypothetical protein VIX80_00655, partial [Candidatus Kapabacteria bacterium]
ATGDLEVIGGNGVFGPKARKTNNPSNKFEFEMNVVKWPSKIDPKNGTAVTISLKDPVSGASSQMTVKIKKKPR